MGLFEGLAAMNPVALGASALSGGLNFMAQEKTNQVNTDASNNQMNFQREMSNTAIQRSKADMLAADFNPMLALQTQASSPAGSMATAQSSNPGDSLQASLEFALNSAQTRAQIKNIEAQTAKTETESKILEPEATKGSWLNDRYKELMGIIDSWNEPKANHGTINRGPPKNPNKAQKPNNKPPRVGQGPAQEYFQGELNNEKK